MTVNRESPAYAGFFATCHHFIDYVYVSAIFYQSIWDLQKSFVKGKKNSEKL